MCLWPYSSNKNAKTWQIKCSQYLHDNKNYNICIFFHDTYSVYLSATKDKQIYLVEILILLIQVVTELSFYNFYSDRTVLSATQSFFWAERNFSVTEMSFGGQNCPFFWDDDRSVLFGENFGQECPFPFLYLFKYILV